MITKRIIPCLDVRNGRVVKGTNFEGIRDVADPVEMARLYNAAGADELVFYDITASFEGRALFTDILTQVASEIFIPLTVGGGIHTLEDFDRFLAEAHRLGLRVILDWVANHTSPDARWIEERPADWYVRDSQGNTIVQYDWTDIAKLDYGNADMRAAMAAAMRFWLDRGIDGFRCDMACEVPIDFWQQTLPALRKEYPGIYLLAEGEAPALHDGAFDASYAWELHHLLNDIAQGRKSAADLRAYVARDAAAMPREAFRLMFTSNHDENSWAGTEFERMGDAARVMALLTFTLPNGQPLVYTGQEMGFDHRFEFFEKDPVPAWERNGFTDFYAALIRLRHENPALAAGERGGQAAYPLGERTPDGLMLFPVRPAATR